MESEEQLQRLIENLEKRDATLSAQQDSLLSEVQMSRASKNKVRCKQKFVEYKRVQLQRERLGTYKDTVMAHIDALNNTELNKALISTLQESAKTLKAMGVVDGVKQAELVVADVESSMAQVQELTQVLGQPIHVDYNSQDWDLELEELLKDEQHMPTAVALPVSVNHIHERTVSQTGSKEILFE